MTYKKPKIAWFGMIHSNQDHQYLKQCNYIQSFLYKFLGSNLAKSARFGKNESNQYLWPVAPSSNLPHWVETTFSHWIYFHK